MRNEKVPKRKLMSAKEVQDEFLNIDIKRLRAFLNENITFIKIGNRYYYHRIEVERLLCDSENNQEFKIGTY